MLYISLLLIFSKIFLNIKAYESVNKNRGRKRDGYRKSEKEMNRGIQNEIELDMGEKRSEKVIYHGVSDYVR